jgi:Abhydrolase family
MRSHLFSVGILLLAGPILAAEPDPTRIYHDDQKPSDARLGKPKDLNGYFPFTPPASKETWNDRAPRVREQMLVATGLWPMPERTPLNPVIHGKIERDGYTIEKVYFASLPGHYVTGNLYRPTAKADGKRPAVLSPHGHWNKGRFYDAGDAEAKKQIETKAEKTNEAAHFPLQARQAQLARLGFVVFHYDMVGYADSTAIPHREGFTDAEAELRLQSFMGLQTWNSIRALDFITSLPDVDPKRVGVSGASGGGTQTFTLCAVDERPAAAFPAVMVSTAMQGGCICENCSHLRVGTGNIEFAGLFAPKPLAMSAAKDWTIDIETKGLPELKQLYKLFDAEDKVLAKCWPEFPHNYNLHARELQYAWFSKHLLGKDTTIEEQPFMPVPPKELSVFDANHPRPKDELDAAGLRKVMTERSEKQIRELEPKDAQGLAELRKIIGPALRAMVHDELPKQLRFPKALDDLMLDGGVRMHRALVGRKGEEDAVPMIELLPEGHNGTVVIWVHPAGKSSLFDKGQLTAEAKAILEKKAAILAPDLFGTGELKSDKPFPVDQKFAGFTYGYNPSVLANRVHDILTAVALAKGPIKAKEIRLVGWGEAGPWVVLARALCGDAVQHTVVDLNQFRFENVKATDDAMMLPGAVKYGGLPAFLALCAPGEVFAHNAQGTDAGKLSQAAYEAAGAKENLTRQEDKAPAAKVVEWLLR